MQLGQYADESYENGDVVLKVHVAALAKPALQAFKAKIDSGEIDLVKGTDIDKAVADKVLDLVLAML